MSSEKAPVARLSKQQMKAQLEQAATLLQGKTKVVPSTPKADSSHGKKPTGAAKPQEEVESNTNRPETAEVFMKKLQQLGSVPAAMKNWASNGELYHTPDEDGSWTIEKSSDGACLEYRGELISKKGKDHIEEDRPLILVHIHKDKGTWLALTRSRDLTDEAERLAVSVKSTWGEKTVKALKDTEMHWDGKVIKIKEKFSPFPTNYAKWLLGTREDARMTGASNSQEDKLSELESMQVVLAEPNESEEEEEEKAPPQSNDDDTQVPERETEAAKESRDDEEPSLVPKPTSPAKKKPLTEKERQKEWEEGMFPTRQAMRMEKVDLPTVVDLSKEDEDTVQEAKQKEKENLREWAKKAAPKIDDKGRALQVSLSEKREKEISILLSKLQKMKADNLASAIAEQLQEDPDTMNEASKMAKILREEKLKGDFIKASTEVLKKSEGNVLRDLNPALVKEKKERIVDLGWYEQSTIIGAVEPDTWKKLKPVLEKLDEGEEAEIPKSLKGCVEVLDGQHRFEAIDELVAEGVLSDYPRARLLVYVGLTKDEKRIVSVISDLINTSMAATTLADLLKQMRDYWLELVYDRKMLLLEAEKKVTLRFQQDMVAKTKSASAKEVKKAVPEKGIKMKAKEEGEEGETISQQTLMGTMLSNLHYKLKFGYQVPLEPISVWPLWYRFLKEQETTSGPYTQEHLSEMASMQWSVRKFAMYFAAKNKLPASNFRQLCRFLKGHDQLLNWFKEDLLKGILVKNQYDDPSLTGEGPKAQAIKWLDYFVNCRGFDPLCMVNNNGRFDPKSPEMQHLAVQLQKSIANQRKPTSKDVMSYYVVWSMVSKYKSEPHLLLQAVCSSIAQQVAGWPHMQLGATGDNKVHTLLVDSRFSHNKLSIQEIQFRAKVVKKALEDGFLVVCLADEMGMVGTLNQLGTMKVRRYAFPVLSHKGYVQDPEEPSGGTGLFVLVFTVGLDNLELFRDCDVDNYMPQVGFCRSANSFFLRSESVELSWPKAWERIVPETETVPQEFFYSLPLFFSTSHNSVLFVLSAHENDCIAFAGRSYLENRRRVVFMGETHRNNILKRLVPACAVVASSSSEVLSPPKSVKDLAEFLPPSSNFQKKVVGFTFLDPIIAEPLMVTWQKTNKSIEDTLKEDDREVVAKLRAAEKAHHASWKQSDEKPYSGEWASQMRSPGYLRELHDERREAFDAQEAVRKMEVEVRKATRDKKQLEEEKKKKVAEDKNKKKKKKKNVKKDSSDEEEEEEVEEVSASEYKGTKKGTKRKRVEEDESGEETPKASKSKKQRSQKNQTDE